MSALTGLYISQSYGGLIHLSTNTGIVSGTYTQLQDGLGTNLNLYINSNGSISGSSFTGSLFGTASQAVSASFASTASIARDLVIRARNGNNASLPAGTVVHITGAVGDNPIFNTASFDTELLSANTLGILAGTAATNQDVDVVVNGIVLGVNTDPANGYVAGDIIYLSSSGQFTKVQPQAPQQVVALGQVLRAQQNNGSIYVSINNGWELDELHNVRIVSSSFGDLLVNSGSLWINSKQLSGSYGLTGSLAATSFTGSLFGTASVALFAISSSTSAVAQAVTASGRTIYSLLPGETPTNFSVTQSIILGTQTGVNSQGAYQGIFIGSTAGNGATNAYSSTFLGASAGQGAKEANEAIFVGNYAGQNAISSSDSIFIGNSAGLGYAPPSPVISKASGSIFIGASAGQTSANLDTSIAIGLGAGSGNNQTGSRGAIILGAWAGFNSEWGTNNIMIGNGVTLPSGRRDSINIAGIIYGTGSYNNGLIPASSANPVTDGKIGINKSVPVYSLDVSGSGNYSAGLTVTGSLQVTGSVVINTSGSFVMPLSASASPVAGSTYFSVATKKLFIYDGSAWVSASLG